MKISVCMAVYNGATYLSEQVDSILIQLGADDELVVVDDCSTDDSRLILSEINDARVRLYFNECNLGVLATFQRALSLAVGEILFLSDQDDVWLSDKVETFMSIFRNEHDLTMLVSDAEIINAAGLVVSSSFYSRRGRFWSGVFHNIVKNKYLGCTMAFRRSMLIHFLPIPSDVPMHDVWFGILNAMYGRVHYVGRPLILYRRHDMNVSSEVGAGLLMKIKWRWILVKNLVIVLFFRKR